MTGHRSFEELRRSLGSERRARNERATTVMLNELALRELRQLREKTQKQLAHDLKIGQPAVARLEKRADMYVSNLRKYVEALGGQLEIVARFPDTSVTIKNFGELAGPDDQR